MHSIRYGWLLGLVFWMTVIDVYGQLEQVEAHYAQLQEQNQQQPDTLHFVQEDSNWVADFSKLSQIILIRHGEPALQHNGWRKRSEAMEYVRAYDSVGIFPPAFIPLILVAGELGVIHTSSINRSISTAKQVFQQPELLQSDTLFREFERKVFAFPNVKLPLKMWLRTSRVLWFMNLNDKGVENRTAAKDRAQKAARFLEQDALKNRKTLLVSHGLLNRYLEKYLNERGWKTVYNGGHGYLSQKMLVRYGP